MTVRRLVIVLGVLLGAWVAVADPMIGVEAPGARLDHHGNWNLPLPTMGGKQVWRDHYVHGGWRIQENVLTGHFRLLDPDNWRRAWGRYEDLRTHFDAMKIHHDIVPASDHLVVLLHGMAALSPFSKTKVRLQEDGYDVIDPRYPSTRDGIEAHAAGLARLLSQLDGTQRVSFVTHSMGGLVLRRLLADQALWQGDLALGVVIMVAPPHQGAALAEVVHELPGYDLILGTAGRQLMPEAAATLPPLSQPFVIIAGGRGDGQGYNPLLEGDDDGVVRLAETRLEGATHRYTVPALHMTIANDPTTQEIILDHLGRHTTVLSKQRPDP
ncbi:MAG: hypothetical protein AAF530_15450 [Pseudomonadota bacterium]